MSCLIYRNVSGKEVSQALARCQQDQTLPLLSTLLGFGIARYLYLGQSGRSLTGVSGDCIILEDAFRKESFVPLSTCEDFSILKAFLEFHYRGTTAEILVKTGRFNMMLGSRRGLVIRNTDWSTQGRIKPQQRVVMAVYLETDVKKCIHCPSELTLTEPGKFFCMSRQGYFRDYDTLKYFSQLVLPLVDQSQSVACLLMVRTSTTQNLLAQIEGTEDTNDVIDLDGLQNVDLRLKQRRKQDDVRAEPEGDRDLEGALTLCTVLHLACLQQALQAQAVIACFHGLVSSYSYMTHNHGDKCHAKPETSEDYFITFEASQYGRSQARHMFGRFDKGLSVALGILAHLHIPSHNVDAEVNLYHAPSELCNYPQVLLLERQNKKRILMARDPEGHFSYPATPTTSPAIIDHSVTGRIKKLFYLNIAAARAVVTGTCAARRPLSDEDLTVLQYARLKIQCH